MNTNLGVAFAPQITAAAVRHHLDPRLLAAVAAQETGGPGNDSGRNIVGDGGHGRGLFQIDDRWHPFARTPGAMDPAQNADYAAGLIAGNLRTYNGDLHAALSAYNAGSPEAAGTTTDWGHGVHLGYADSVLRHYAELGSAPATPGAFCPPDGTTAEPDVNALLILFHELGPGATSVTPQTVPAHQPFAPPATSSEADLAPDALAASGDAL